GTIFPQRRRWVPASQHSSISAALMRMLKPDRDGVLERKIALKLRSRTPSLLQDCAFVPALFG
ncbi:MAG: hypothetical protein WCH75_24690, partial [Candidatus Binatia bacterium]